MYEAEEFFVEESDASRRSQLAYFVPLEIQTSIKHGPGPKSWYKHNCSL